MKRFVLFSSILLAGIAIHARAAVVYDFENPPYTLGSLSGQDGWTYLTGPGLATVADVTSAGTPPFGSQYVSLSGNVANPGSEGMVTNTLAGSGFTNVTVLSLQMAFSHLGQSYAEIALYDSANVAYAQLGFEPPGYYVYTNGASYVYQSLGAASNTVYDVDVTLDFNTQIYQVTFSTNSVVAYNSGLVTFKAATTATLAGNGHILLRGGYNNGIANGIAYFDNISVMAVVPETIIGYGFENPPYTLGNVIGQDGWGSAVAGTVATVTNAVTPPFGAQYLRLSGDGVTFGSEGLVTNSLAGFGFSTITNISLRMAFASIGQSYAEISLYDSANVAYAQLGFDPAEYYVYTNGPGLQLTYATVSPNTVYDVNVALNFAAQKYQVTFSTNSVIAYNSGLVTFKAATTAAQAAHGHILLRGGYFNGTFNGIGYFDNISVSGVDSCTVLMFE